MLQKHRHSFFARLTAVGFIIVLLLGNIWLADALLSKIPPSWVIDGLWVGLGIAFFGGVGLFILSIRDRWLNRFSNHN